MTKNYKRKEKEFTSRLKWLHSYIKENPFIEEIQLWDSVLFTKSSVGRAKFKSKKDLAFPKSYKPGATIVFPSPGRGQTWTAKDKTFFLEHCYEDQEQYDYTVFKISSLMVTDKWDFAAYLNSGIDNSSSALGIHIKEVKMAHRFVTLLGSIAGLAGIGLPLNEFLKNLKFSTRKTPVNKQAIINKIKATPHLKTAIADPHYGFKFYRFDSEANKCLWQQSASAEELECLKQTRQLLGIPHTEPTEPPQSDDEQYHQEFYDEYGSWDTENTYYTPKKTWQELLNYQQGDTLKEVKIKWKRLALEYHPDINKNPDATERMQEINNAWEQAQEFFERDYAYAGIRF